MLALSQGRTARDLVPKIERVFELSAAKIRALEARWTPSDGTPVFTVKGNTPRADGRNGPRASNSAARSCSSTPPAIVTFWTWAVRAP